MKPNEWTDNVALSANMRTHVEVIKRMALERYGLEWTDQQALSFALWHSDFTRRNTGDNDDLLDALAIAAQDPAHIDDFVSRL